MAVGDDEKGVALTQELMELSKLGKTIDGTSFAYLQLDCVGRSVASIGVIGAMLNLQQVDLSKNSITDIAPLTLLPYVLKLNLAGNAISTLDPVLQAEGCLPHLMDLDLSENKLEALPPLAFPALRVASFAKNAISTCGGYEGLPHLRASTFPRTSSTTSPE